MLFLSISADSTCEGSPVFPLMEATFLYQLIISKLSMLPHTLTLSPHFNERSLLFFKHVVEDSLSVFYSGVVGSSSQWAHDKSTPQHNRPGAVLGRRPVRLLCGAPCFWVGLFLALCSPWRAILPQLHGEMKGRGLHTGFSATWADLFQRWFRNNFYIEPEICSNVFFFYI